MITMLTISRTFILQAAHHLPATPEGHKCHGMHGHTWECRVFVRGPMDPQLMWIIDFADIDAIWKAHVFDVLDHKVLNDTIPNPTTEAIVLWIYNAMAVDISKAASDARLVRIELGEGPHNRCDLDIEYAPSLSTRFQVARDATNRFAPCDGTDRRPVR